MKKCGAGVVDRLLFWYVYRHGMAYLHLSNVLVIKWLWTVLDHRVMAFSIRGCDLTGEEAIRELVSLFFFFSFLLFFLGGLR